MRRWIVLLLLLGPMAILAQNTNVTATITDSNGQTWYNGSYSITFVPNPTNPGPYYWEGVPFAPQKYTGVMDNTGNLSITLPDNGTITPAGSQWGFVLCANTSAPCSTVTTPVTGVNQNFTGLFSSRVTPPQVYATPLVRAYSSSEVSAPPLDQGGQYYNVTGNIPYFWTGTMWINLGGTVSNFSSGNLAPLFTTSVANSGTTPALSFAFSNAAAYNVFANCTASSATPAYCQLNAAMIALAGTLSNNTTGSAGSITGGYVASISSGSTQLTITPTTGNSVATLVTTGSEGKVVTAANAGTNGHCPQWDALGGIGDSGAPCYIPPATLSDQYNTFTGCNFANDGANLACTNTVTLGTAMADTSYTLTCTEYTDPAMGTVVLGQISYAVVSTTQYTLTERTQGSSTEWTARNGYGKSYVCHAHHN
jgi:hypothetical protein